jgi:hypothetical protein
MWLDAVLATVSRSTARPSTDVASPSAAPAGPFAVMVHAAGGDEPYFVSLVPLSGLGGAWVQPTTRSLKTALKKSAQQGEASPAWRECFPQTSR